MGSGPTSITDVGHAKLVPPAGTVVRASAEGSSYSVGLMAVVREAGAWHVLSCAQFVLLGDLSMALPPGREVFILAFDDTPGSQGGTLRFNVRKALPVPTVQVTINPIGVLKAGGSVHVSGTASCQGPRSVLGDVAVSLAQERKIGTLVGFEGLSLTVKCGDTPITWSFDVAPEFVIPPDPSTPPPTTIPPFRAGAATADVSAFAFNADQAGSTGQQTTITVVKS